MGTAVSSVKQCCDSFGLLLQSTIGGSNGHPSSVVINGASYRIDRLLGEGGYAFVYLATDRIGGSKLALKRFVVHDPEDQTKYLEETRVHRSLCPNDNIVTFVDSEVKSGARGSATALPEVWVAMEYVAGPSLQSLVNAKLSTSKRISRNEVISIFQDVVTALAHMHSQSPPISHWDVKLDNVLQGDRYKLCDFGSCSKVFYLCQNPNDITVAEVELGEKMTLLYRAPETLDLWAKKKIDTKVDVWSLGVMMYTLLLLEMPFEENPLDVLTAVPKKLREKKDVFRAATVGDSENPCPADVQDIFEIVMQHMLVKDPTERKDIFAVGELVAGLGGREGVAHFSCPPRPRPGFVSAQKPRFSN